ncbi:MAG: hypothetical protein Q9190_001627 [Brigantiaea leucoxantha]
MPSVDQHTPLETLLFLQILQQNGAEPPSFEQISASLKNRKLLRRDEDSSREHLDASSLKSLYLRLLKEEVKIQAQNGEHVSRDQDGQPNPRKRKLSSPRLETVDEAMHYGHLIPQLADRMYLAFRHEAIDAIQDEERKYRKLEKEVQEINCGERDAPLQTQEPPLNKSTRGVSSIKGLLRDDPVPASAEPKKPNGQIQSPSHPDPINESGADQGNAAPQPVKPQPTLTEANGESIQQNGLASSLEATASPTAGARQDVSETAVPQPIPSREPAHTQLNVPDVIADASKHPPQRLSADNGVPFLPPPNQARQSLPALSPSPDTQRRAPQVQTNIAPFPSSRSSQATLPAIDRPAGSPIILPPPAGMLRASGSPKGPLDAPTVDVPGPLFRPTSNAPSSGQSPTPMIPHPSQYPHPPQSYPPRPLPVYDGRQPYQGAYSPYPGGYYSSGYQQPPNASPYQYPTTSPGQHTSYGSRPPYVASYPHYSPYSHPTPYQSHSPMQSPYTPVQHPRFPEPTPSMATTATGKVKAPRPAPINTSVSSTKWKNAEIPGNAESPRSPLRPGSREISPISEKAPSPVVEFPTIEQPVKRNKRGRPPASKTSHNADKPVPPPPRGRGRRGRGGSTRGRTIRDVSSNSSAKPSRTRSGSLASHADADELSLEPPPSTTTVNASRIIKPEPATPARGSSTPTPPISTENKTVRKPTRNHPDNLREIKSRDGPGTHDTGSTRPGTKRKRAEPSPLGSATLPRFPSSTHPQQHQHSQLHAHLSKTHVLGSRNFPRTSATLINGISAHKHASIFAKPITEREAPGYHSLVYRSQDLKSIKAAISTGNKALIAAADKAGAVPVNSLLESGSNTRGTDVGNLVWVPKTPDVVPPKGIVNGAQLEMEICRIFADAVMFNRDFGASREVGVGVGTKGRGEEVRGVVGDAREMFGDVERMVGQWREAERVDEGWGWIDGLPTRTTPGSAPAPATTTTTTTGETATSNSKKEIEDTEEPDELAAAAAAEDADGIVVAIGTSVGGNSAVEEEGIAQRASKRRRR